MFSDSAIDSICMVMFSLSETKRDEVIENVRIYDLPFKKSLSKGLMKCVGILIVLLWPIMLRLCGNSTLIFNKAFF